MKLLRNISAENDDAFKKIPLDFESSLKYGQESAPISDYIT
jgi:hypothetical protein